MKIARLLIITAVLVASIFFLGCDRASAPVGPAAVVAPDRVPADLLPKVEFDASGRPVFEEWRVQALVRWVELNGPHLKPAPGDADEPYVGDDDQPAKGSSGDDDMPDRTRVRPRIECGAGAPKCTLAYTSGGGRVWYCMRCGEAFWAIESTGDCVNARTGVVGRCDGMAPERWAGFIDLFWWLNGRGGYRC